MTDRMYVKESDEVFTSITIGPESVGTIRAVTEEGVWNVPISLPALLTFEGPVHVTVHTRDDLDDALTGRGYVRFEI